MKSAMVAFNGASWAVLLLAGMLMFVTTSAYVVPYVASGIAKDKPGYYSGTLEGQNPEYILQTLSRLRQALLAEEDLEQTKRGMDLGLQRGYSGSQAAKHLMGLAAANFAGGPGRRRRSSDDDA